MIYDPLWDLLPKRKIPIREKLAEILKKGHPTDEFLKKLFNYQIPFGPMPELNDEDWKEIDFEQEYQEYQDD